VFEPNDRQITALLDGRPAALVLDVGGWACPFNRANWVLDAEPYETRGYYKTVGLPASQGGVVEYFTPDTWVQRDICDKAPWPFADKFFDFSICSHTLEDVRDPLYVCAELVRVSKAGYVEVPSRAAESCRGWEHPRIAGLSHHRWLIDVDGTHIQFTHKYHALHGDFENALPRRYLESMRPEDKVSFFFWEGTFTVGETTLHGVDRQRQYLQEFVASRYQYSLARRWYAASGRTLRQVAGSVRRRLGFGRASQAR
jgi:SAM-dependent methyltransferase